MINDYKYRANQDFVDESCILDGNRSLTLEAFKNRLIYDLMPQLYLKYYHCLFLYNTYIGHIIVVK